MDEHQGTPLREDSFAQKSARLLDKLRAKTDEMRAEENARWSKLESRLTENLGTIESEIARQQGEISADRADSDAQAADFARLQDDIRDEQREMAEYLQEQQDRLALQEQELSQREKLVDQAEHAQQDAEKLLEDERSELERARAQIHEREAAANRQNEQLASDRQRLKEQRNAVGEKLREQRNSQQAAAEKERDAINKRRAEIDQRSAEVTRRHEVLERQENDARHDASTQLTELQGRFDDLSETFQALIEEHETLSGEHELNRKDLSKAADTRDALAEALADAEETLAKVNEQLAAQPDVSELQTKFDLAVEEARDLRAENAELEERLTSGADSKLDEADALAEMRDERDALVKQMEDLQNLPPADTDDSRQQELDDLRTRFEMAVDDVRRLKNEKEELEQQLASRDQPTDRTDESASHSGNGLDWEAMKGRLMASLEEEFDPDDEEDVRERTTIEGTIRITDDIVEEKDKEILELKGLLENQTESIGEVAVGAAAVAELFDQDEAIQQERDRLRELQTEWEDKLRQSELEFSVQRAKLARGRTDVDQKQQELDQRQAEIDEAAEAGPVASLRKPTRRWLSRLGLNKDEED